MRSIQASEFYREILEELAEEGLNGLGFLKKLARKIKGGLDKLGETGIGKAFRKIRDTAIIPAIKKLPGGTAIYNKVSKAGDAFNSFAKGGANNTSNELVQQRTRPNSPASRSTTPARPTSRSAQPTASNTRNAEPPANEDEPKKEDNKLKVFVKKHKKAIIIAVVLIVLGIIGYMIYKNQKAKKKKPTKRRKKSLSGVTNAQLLAALEKSNGGKTQTRRKKPTAKTKKRKPARRKKQYKITVGKPRGRKKAA